MWGEEDSTLINPRKNPIMIKIRIKQHSGLAFLTVGTEKRLFNPVYFPLPSNYNLIFFQGTRRVSEKYRLRMPLPRGLRVTSTQFTVRSYCTHAQAYLRPLENYDTYSLTKQ
jgi:hypothetical protein